MHAACPLTRHQSDHHLQQPSACTGPSHLQLGRGPTCRRRLLLELFLVSLALGDIAAGQDHCISIAIEARAHGRSSILALPVTQHIRLCQTPTPTNIHACQYSNAPLAPRRASSAADCWPIPAVGPVTIMVRPSAGAPTSCRSGKPFRLTFCAGSRKKMSCEKGLRYGFLPQVLLISIAASTRDLVFNQFLIRLSACGLLDRYKQPGYGLSQVLAPNETLYFDHQYS